MVDELTADNGGAEPEIGTFTRHVEADQNIEINRMQDLLAQLEGDPNSLAPRRVRRSQQDRDRASRSAFAGGRPLICYVG